MVTNFFVPQKAENSLYQPGDYQLLKDSTPWSKQIPQFNISCGKPYLYYALPSLSQRHSIPLNQVRVQLQTD